MTNLLSSKVQAEQRVWGKSDSLNYYQTHRQEPEELYASERFFLPEVLSQVSSCLDIGCAAGGFSRIMKSFNPQLAYTGVDIIPEFITVARREHPDSHFEIGDGIHFSTPPDSFDLVYSSGILHLNSRYREIVQAAYAQARRYLLCDFRLTHGPSVIGKFRVEFENTSAAPAELPYIVLDLDELVNELQTLTPVPRSIRARGYYHAPSPTATLPLSQIIMAFFLIEKGNGFATTNIQLELPEGQL